MNASCLSFSPVYRPRRDRTSRSMTEAVAQTASAKVRGGLLLLRRGLR